METANALREWVKQIIDSFIGVWLLCGLVWLVWLRVEEMWRERELFPAWIKKFLFTISICVILTFPRDLTWGARAAVAFRVVFLLFIAWKYIDEYLIGGISSGKERSRKRLEKKLKEADEMSRSAFLSSGEEEKKAYLHLEKKILAEYHAMLDAHEKKYEKSGGGV